MEQFSKMLTLLTCLRATVYYHTYDIIRYDIIVCCSPYTERTCVFKALFMRRKPNSNVCIRCDVEDRKSIIHHSRGGQTLASFPTQHKAYIAVACRAPSRASNVQRGVSPPLAVRAPSNTVNYSVYCTLFLRRQRECSRPRALN